MCVLRFYGPVNPMGSCRARSVYLTTLCGQAQFSKYGAQCCIVPDKAFFFQQGCMCAQRRLRSACASAQSDLSLHCPSEDALDSWLSTGFPAKIMIGLCECAGRSVFIGRQNLVGTLYSLVYTPQLRDRHKHGN